MKKSLWVKLMVGLGFVMVLSFSAQAETITLTFANQNPELGWGTSQAWKPWVERIEKASGGRLKIKGYHSQTLAKGKDTWNAVKYGIADMGWCFHPYWPGMTSLADVISMPSLPFKTSEEGSAALWKLYEKFPQIRKQFADNHILLLYTTDPYFLITTEKQVKAQEDLQGLKIRMMGGPSTEMMKALGGVPMSVPMPDNYIAMQKGVTDGMGGSWESILTFRLYEVVKYYTLDTSFPVVYFSIAMNKNKWNSLPKDLQDIFTRESGLNGARFWGRNFFDTAREAMIREAMDKGYEMNIYPLPQSEREKWLKEAGKPIWEDWLAKMKADGHPEAQEILDALLAMF
ncbi:TRAP transporter substrate-binding protein [bacterium]|nr:TRAP transporter substrate-binding protein [bacterium]